MRDFRREGKGKSNEGGGDDGLLISYARATRGRGRPTLDKVDIDAFFRLCTMCV